MSMTAQLRKIAEKNPGKAARKWWYYATDDAFGEAYPALQIQALEALHDRLDGKPVGRHEIYDDRQDDGRPTTQQLMLLSLLREKLGGEPAPELLQGSPTANHHLFRALLADKFSTPQPGPIDAEFTPAPSPQPERRGRGRPRGSIDTAPRKRLEH
jgi:hypothetical protein